jgi:dipeptidase E
MNLYLSSYRIGEKGHMLRELGGTGTAFVIPNALDCSGDVGRRRNSIAREIDDLGEWGIASATLDLRDFFGHQQLLRNHLEGASMLWVVGGNTFLLRRAMALSGLDLILHSKREDPDFLYAGYSAGTCVLCPSLEGIHLADQPQAQADGYSGDVLWTGLGLIDYYFVPHFRCNHFESDAMEAVAAYYDQKNLPYRTVADEGVILDRTHHSEQRDGGNSASFRASP